MTRVLHGKLCGLLKTHELLHNEINNKVGTVKLLSVQNNAKQYKSPAINETFFLKLRGVDLTHFSGFRWQILMICRIKEGIAIGL